jgi:flavodoxin
MKAKVVFESVYGNTEKVARAIGAALEAGAEVQVIPVTELDLEHLADVDLLVVGSPTQAFSPITGTKNLLKQLGPAQLKGIKYAAFDTRLSVEEVNSKVLSLMARLFGYAAEKIDRGLQGKGGVRIHEPAGFIVAGNEGPLKEGEIERAVAWGREILQKF